MTKQVKINCPLCNKRVGGEQGLRDHMDIVHPTGKVQDMEVLEPNDPRVKPDWKHRCIVCGQKPVVPLTGMCGPCTFGEAETYGGNW